MTHRKGACAALLLLTVTGCDKLPARRDGPAPAALSRVLEDAPARELLAYHTVRQGETLAIIAKQYNASAWRMALDNQLGDGHRIYPGQRLRIMGAPRPAPAPYLTETRTTK